MAAVKSKDTRPELAVRRMAFALGYRYRLHSPKLPGHPDLVFASQRKIIFVHGCFWHGHTCRAGRNRPNSNVEYWNKKLDRNVERDRINIGLLEEAGWRVCVIWECETRNQDKLKATLEEFLSTAPSNQ